MDTDHTSLIFEVGYGHRSDTTDLLAELCPDPETALAYNAEEAEIHEWLSLEEALAGLAADTFAHVQWGATGPGVQWCEVHGPHHQTVARTAWVITFEYRGTDWRALFDRVSSPEGCIFAVVSVEESLGFTLPLQRESSFPWDHWRLVLAQVTDRSAGTKRLSPGPALQRLQ